MQDQVTTHTHGSGSTTYLRLRTATGLLTWLMVVVLLVGLQACTTASATSGFELQPGMGGSVFVNGSAPFVMIQNQGPAEVQVVFEQRDEPPIAQRLSVASFGRTVSDGTLVRVKNLDAALSCTILVNVQRYTGMSIDMPAQIEQSHNEPK